MQEFPPLCCFHNNFQTIPNEVNKIDILFGILLWRQRIHFDGVQSGLFHHVRYDELGQRVAHNQGMRLKAGSTNTP